MDTIKLKYSEQQIKQVMRAYFRKKIGVALPILMILLTAFVIYRLVQGDRSWYVGFISSVILFAIVIFASSYVVHLRRSIERFRRMKLPTATMEMNSDQFRIESDVGATEVKWSHISRVQCFPGSWLLFFSGNDFVTLPLEGLSEDSKELILSTAESNGAKIT